MNQLERHLAWEGCANVRDLGGHPTEDGRATRFGAVVRADSVRRLSDAGWRDLVEHGINTIVDLRFHDELEADPPAELPVDVVHISLLGVLDLAYWAEMDAIAAAAPSVAEGTRLVYLDSLERNRSHFGEVFKAIAAAPEGGILLHCQGGKDRTGLVVALLLSLAGVPRDEVARDYAVSERNLAERQAQWEAEAEDDDELERRRRIGACPPEAMLGVLAELERRYGSVRAYLREAGAAEEELDRVAARLT